MLTHVSINSTLRDVLVKYRTVQRLVTIEHKQWLYTVVMLSHNVH